MAAAVSMVAEALAVPTKPAPSHKRLAGAEQDFIWWHSWRAGDLGLNGFDPGSPHILHVDEDERPDTWRIARMASWRVKQANARLPAIEANLELLSPRTLARAEAIYKPYPYPFKLREEFEIPTPKPSAELEETMRQLRKEKGQATEEEPRVFVVSVVGAAMLTEPWRVAWERAQKAPDFERVTQSEWALRLMMAPTQHDKKRGRPLPRGDAFFREAREIALTWRDEVLLAYCEAKESKFSRELRVLRGVETC